MIGQCWAKKEWPGPAMPGVKRVGAEAHDYYGLDSFGLLVESSIGHCHVDTTTKWHCKFNSTSL